MLVIEPSEPLRLIGPGQLWLCLLGERTEADTFQCLAWLYDGFPLPTERNDLDAPRNLASIERRANQRSG